MADHILDSRRAGLEEAFFAEENARLLARLKAESSGADRRKGIAAATGITDAALLDRLAGLNVTAETLGAFALVPLVLVAWADGSISADERAATLRAAGEAGAAPGTAAHALLESWLASKPAPGLAEAWKGYASALAAPMDPAGRAGLRAATLDRARAVAEATGGFLGLTSAVSEAERRVLAELEAALA